VKKLNFIIFHRIVDSHVCVFALGKSVREKSAANEFKAFLWREWKKNRVLFKYLLRIHIAICSFLYTIFFCEAPRSIIIINNIERAEILLLIRIFFSFYFIMNRMKMKMNVCMIIYNYKVKSEKERQQKMQEASFNNLNKQRVKHTFFSRKNVHKKIFFTVRLRFI